MRRFAVLAVGLAATIVWSSGGAVAGASASGGTWGKAEEVPGTAALNAGGFAEILSVSCATAGNCATGGTYTDRGREQGFVVTESNGTWGTAQQVPGLAALNAGGLADIRALSCAAQGFVVNQTNGTWGKAEEVPGLAVLNTGGFAGPDSVSCAAAGNCSAGGSYTDSSGHTQAFVVNQTNGTWGKAEEVPGTAALNTGGKAHITSVSCATAGHCSATGQYKDSSRDTQVFVVGEA